MANDENVMKGLEIFVRWGLGMLFFFFLAIITGWVLWIWQMVRLSKRKNKISFWVVLILGLFFVIFCSSYFGFLWGSFLAGDIGALLGRSEEKKQIVKK